jgi:Flp pilus assembly protein TadD
MEDFNVYLDDDEVAETAALHEPNLVYTGSKVIGAVWLSAVGMAAGGLAAVTLSPAVRGSVTSFALYLAAALLFFLALRPATERLAGGPLVFPARTTVFWAAFLAIATVLSAGVETTWLSYGLTVLGGFFVGMMTGSLNPNTIKNEDAWMGAALPAGIAAAVLAAFVHRTGLQDPTSGIGAMLVGGIAGLVFFAPMSVLLVRLWDEAQGFRSMAMLYLHNDNFAPKAVEYLDKAIALRPGDADLYNLRGIAWSKMDEGERAAADWKRASELNPKDSQPLMNRGVDHLRRNEFDAAIDALNAARALEPENAMVSSNLGNAYEKRGDLARAVEHYDQAIALRPDYANAFANRGYARFRQGDYAGAVADCEKAVQLEPGLGMALVNRGHALAAAGEHRSAAESYYEALELQLAPEAREEALRGLESLGETVDSVAA